MIDGLILRTQEIYTEFFPEIDINRCLGNFFLNEILKGHGIFPSHQHRFYSKPEVCFCTRDIGTITNYIYGCPRFEDIWKKTFPHRLLQFGAYRLPREQESLCGS